MTSAWPRQRRRWQVWHQSKNAEDVEEILAHDFTFRCDASYTEEEMAQLGELVNAVPHTECFTAIFAKSCGSYIKNNLASMFGDMMPAGK